MALGIAPRSICFRLKVRHTKPETSTLPTQPPPFAKPTAPGECTARGGYARRLGTAGFSRPEAQHCGTGSRRVQRTGGPAVPISD